MKEERVCTTITHQGYNVKHLRNMLGVSLDVLAVELNVTPQDILELEEQETLDEETLEKVAGVLHVPVNAIKNWTKEATYNFINTFNDNASLNTSAIHSQNCTFNSHPIDKVVELFEQKEELYERMLKSEQEKNNTLLKLIEKK